MEGTHLAVVVSLLLWAVAYFTSVYSFIYFFSGGILPEKLRVRTKKKTILILLSMMLILVPVLTAMSFRIGGVLEENKGIAWGCYIELATLGSFIIWLLAFLVFSVLFLVSLFNPLIFSFSNRGKAFLFFFIHNAYALTLVLLIRTAIQYLSGPLSGKEASCL